MKQKQRFYEDRSEYKTKVSQRHDFQERKQKEFLTKYLVDDEDQLLTIDTKRKPKTGRSPY